MKRLPRFETLFLKDILVFFLDRIESKLRFILDLDEKVPEKIIKSQFLRKTKKEEINFDAI